MEIEVDRRYLYVLAAAVLLLLVTALTLLGRAHTPQPPRVIGWADWQAAKIERQYRRELNDLAADLEHLAKMLQEEPDPVRAEMAATRLEQKYASGLGLLARQREAVIAAARAVRDWAAGYGTYDYAVAAVNDAMEILDVAGHSDADSH